MYRASVSAGGLRALAGAGADNRVTSRKRRCSGSHRHGN
ncbi:hypothetical protein F750_7138 (plasmid) [Streptomyces sp. PAMC 26508]|nr:hypothetical protein F750_7138 [Streptomyces sp. PAMC 26508]